MEHGRIPTGIFDLDLWLALIVRFPSLDTTNLQPEQAPARSAGFWRLTPDKRGGLNGSTQH
jgi:hypothetical protein